MRYTETSKKQSTIKFAYNQNRLVNQKVNNVETAMTFIFEVTKSCKLNEGHTFN